MKSLLQRIVPEKFSSDSDKKCHSLNGLLIPYSEIICSVRESLEAGIDELGRRILVPNQYGIFFNPEDKQARENREDILIEELHAEMMFDIHRLNPEFQPEELEFIIDSDESLKKGEFYVKAAMIRHQVSFTSALAYTAENSNRPEIKDGLCIEENTVNGCTGVIDVSDTKYIIYTRMNGLHHSYPIIKPRMTVGRSPQCDIVLKSDMRDISRIHARILLADGDVYVQPLGQNVTLLDGREINTGGLNRIKAGQQLKIGSYTLHVDAAH